MFMKRFIKIFVCDVIMYLLIKFYSMISYNYNKCDSLKKKKEYLLS